MGRFWCLLFFSVIVMAVVTFVLGPVYDHWLPEDISRDGHTIDHLFLFILALTSIVFLGTQFCLFVFMWKYDAAKNAKPVEYTHGSHTLEVIWTIIPTGILLFIALYQMNAWADSKMRRPDVAPLLEVTARQFEWRLRYPGPDGEIGTQDDIHTVNDLHIPVNEDILFSLKSMDVLHSFFLPNLRVKQDAVPGMKQWVWFRALEEGEYDLVCAELCGWGHYKMKGRITVESRAQFDKWLEEQYLAQEATQDPALAASEN